MVHFNNSTLTPIQKINLENSLQQSFVTLKKPLTFSYIYATSEERDYSRNNYLHTSSRSLKAHFHLKSIYDLICMRADEVLFFNVFLKPFQASFHFLYPFKGTNQ